jgi:hypothetical protein
MITVCIFVALLAVLVVAAVLDNRRRRGVLEANLPPGLSRAARRRILRDQRAPDRAAQARYAAELPYVSNIGDGGAGGF